MKINIINFYVIMLFLLVGCSNENSYGISPSDDLLTRKVFVMLLENNKIKYIYKDGFYFVDENSRERVKAISREANSISLNKSSLVFGTECERSSFLKKVEELGIPFVIINNGPNFVEFNFLKRDVDNYNLVENASLIKASCEE